MSGGWTSTELGTAEQPLLSGGFLLVSRGLSFETWGGARLGDSEVGQQRDLFGGRRGTAVDLEAELTAGASSIKN
jgi:hypothetical protein